MRWWFRAANSLAAHLRGNLWRFNLRTIWRDVDAIEVDRPIFLLGTQGGGLTLLSRMLQRNPSVVNVWGDSRHWAGSDELQAVMASRLPESLRLRHHPELEARGLDDSWTYATDEMLPHFRRTRENANEPDARSLLRAIRELLLLHTGGGPGYRFLDKSQSFTVKVGFIDALLADSRPRFVLVLRNPYAMCRRAACKVLDDAGTSHRKRVRRAAEHWENSYRCALEDGSRIDRMMVLRFEDLLEDPADRLERLCGFLDLDYRAQMLPSPGQTRPLGSSRDGKWYPLRRRANEPYLDALSVSEVEIVEARCGTLAERFEYTPDGP